MYRNGEILAPSHPSTASRALARPVVTGPIIDLYPNFDTPKPKPSPRRNAGAARPFPRAWLWTSLLLAAAITGAITFRGPIVEAVPSLSDAYAAIGLPADDTSLHLANVRVIGVYGRDEISFTIQGEVANSAGRLVEVPAIELAVRSIDGRILSTQTLDPARSMLSPGGTIRFATEIVDPPAGAYDITIRIGNGPVEIFDFM